MKSLKLVILGVGHGVAQIDEELGQTSFGCSVVPQHVGKGRISKRLGKALSKRLTGPVVVA